MSDVQRHKPGPDESRFTTLDFGPRTLDSNKMLDGLSGTFSTILVDPPWRFQNRTGKMAPEHRRLRRYRTMDVAEIQALPVARHARDKSHLYLWCPNALLEDGLSIFEAWGFTYKTNLVWLKIRKDGGPDGRGVGFYFRNVTELLLFGVRGKLRHVGARPSASKCHRPPQAGTLTQAGRAVHPDRAMQPRAVSRAVRQGASTRLDVLG